MARVASGFAAHAFLGAKSGTHAHPRLAGQLNSRADGNRSDAVAEIPHATDDALALNVALGYCMRIAQRSYASRLTLPCHAGCAADFTDVPAFILGGHEPPANFVANRPAPHMHAQSCELLLDLRNVEPRLIRRRQVRMFVREAKGFVLELA